MKAISQLLSGMMVVLLAGSVSVAHGQTVVLDGEARVLFSSVDGSSVMKLQTGTYAVFSYVGQSVAGTMAQGSKSLWQMQQRLKAAQEIAALQTVADVPTVFALEANYPNPFDPETTIQVAVPESGWVRLEVYDVLGREVARLIDGTMEVGRHTVVFDGRSLPSGLYVYRMTAGSFEQHRTMMLVK